MVEDRTQKKIIVMNGPHGAGKTTLSKRISPAIGVEFIPEIGGKLRQEVSYNSLESSVDFDREVMRREILRDHQLLRLDDNKRYIVETWHTGNIAYATQRSPGIIPIYLREYEKQLRKFLAMHLLINVDDQTFMKRITEKVPDDKKDELLMFYKNIIESTKSLYSRYDLPFEEFDNSGDLGVAEMMVTRSINSYIS
jgi:deoxyadenosine/deoxycytidine kinase